MYSARSPPRKAYLPGTVLFDCEVCGAVFTSRDHFNRHKANAERFDKCGRCDAPRCTKKYAATHELECAEKRMPVQGGTKRRRGSTEDDQTGPQVMQVAHDTALARSEARKLEGKLVDGTGQRKGVQRSMSAARRSDRAGTRTDFQNDTKRGESSGSHDADAKSGVRERRGLLDFYRLLRR